jgi:hypothetical protein
VRALHGLIGRIEGPTPVVEVARALDIMEVRECPLDGCEGVLLTDRTRKNGSILVNNRRGAQAARFSIAHELGHFLLERHVLGIEEGMVCTVSDLRESRTGRQQMQQHKKQEIEANEFAIGLLVPTYALVPIIRADPAINAAVQMQKQFDISLEAATRCLVERHEEPLAAIWAKDGVIRYVVRGARFPWITWKAGQRLSALSRTPRYLAEGRSGMTAMGEVAPAAWTYDDIPELFEQVRVGKDGHSLTLLWATLPDAVEEEE